MVIAADLSQRLGHINAADAERVRHLVQRAGLPVKAPDLGTARYLDLMRHDKKSRCGRDPLCASEASGRGVCDRSA